MDVKPYDGHIQRLYARWLDAATKTGFAASLCAFLLYVSGALPPYVPLERLPYISNGPYHTNTRAGLALAQEILLRKKTANRRIVLLTDGRNEDDNSITLTQLINTLGQENDTARPVPVITSTRTLSSKLACQITVRISRIMRSSKAAVPARRSSPRPSRFRWCRTA